MSDAAPLIHLSLAHRLELLPQLHDDEETQHYRELPDAIEIAKVAGKWLSVRTVKNRKEVGRLLGQKLGEGEAEAMVLFGEIRADSLLTSDRYAASKAASLGVKTITIGDVIREAYGTKVLAATEAVRLLETLVGQNITNTSYLRELQREAREWL